MDKPRPYLIAALFCESIIEEKNSSLTVVRIADRIDVQTEGLPEGVKPMIQVKGLVSLKSGPVVGEFQLKIKVTVPSGGTKEITAFPIKLLGNDQGQNTIIHMSLGVEEDGLYWFHVLFEDDELTRIPLMLVRSVRQAGLKV